MIIGISGRIESGKDTVGKIIQYLEAETNKGWTPEFTLQEFINGRDIYNMNYVEDYIESISGDSGWQVKKFAYKLKQIVSILTGIPVDDLEKQEVKDKVLGVEWNYNTVFEHSGKLLSASTALHNLPDKSLTVRELLQKVGTDAMREVIHPNIWVNALFADYKCVCNNCRPEECNQMPNWIITDVRFPNEAEAIKQRGGVVWKVVRPCEYCNTIVHEKYSHKMGCERPNKQEHESETALDNYKEFDEVIENNGSIEELTQKVKTAFHKLKQTK